MVLGCLASAVFVKYRRWSNTERYQSHEQLDPAPRTAMVPNPAYNGKPGTNRQPAAADGHSALADRGGSGTAADPGLVAYNDADYDPYTEARGASGGGTLEPDVQGTYIVVGTEGMAANAANRGAPGHLSHRTLYSGASPNNAPGSDSAPITTGLVYAVPIEDDATTTIGGQGSAIGYPRGRPQLAAYEALSADGRYHPVTASGPPRRAYNHLDADDGGGGDGSDVNNGHAGLPLDRGALFRAVIADAHPGRGQSEAVRYEVSNSDGQHDAAGATDAHPGRGQSEAVQYEVSDSDGQHDAAGATCSQIGSPAAPVVEAHYLVVPEMGKPVSTARLTAYGRRDEDALPPVPVAPQDYQTLQQAYGTAPAGCPAAVYDLLLERGQLDPSTRPTFAQIDARLHTAKRHHSTATSWDYRGEQGVDGSEPVTYAVPYELSAASGAARVEVTAASGGAAYAVAPVLFDGTDADYAAHAPASDAHSEATAAELNYASSQPFLEPVLPGVINPIYNQPGRTTNSIDVLGGVGEPVTCQYHSATDGMACRNQAQAGREHCQAHACAHPGCANAKSSQVSLCDVHASVVPGTSA